MWPPRGHLWLQSLSVVFAAQQNPLVRAVEFDGAFHANASIVNDAFENYVQEQMERWQVPGIAMTVLEGNNTWMKGFGYANTNKDPVTASTLFYCGSMTKSFTAAALSQLVDESHKYSGINWTSKVSHLLPEFVLSDEWATKHITVEDVLSHRTGYPTHDNTGLYGNSSERMVRNLRNLPMSYEPREKWQYSNLMYGAMGYLIERLANTTLANYFRDRLWHPMGMNNTYLHPADAMANGETLCQPFYWNNDTKEYGVVPWKDEHNVAAAGMTISSVKDWAQYLRHLIEESGPISKAGHAAVRQPRMIGLPLPYFVGSIYYGFGWESTVFQNENIWWHSGLVDRMMSIMVIIPNRKFAFVIMMNASRQPALDSILMKALYDHFKVPYVDRVDVAASWTSEMDEVVQRLKGCPTKLFPSTANSKSQPPPPVILDNFVGTYREKGYGNITLSKLCGWENPQDSPAKLTLTRDRCVLSIKKQNVFNREISYKLQHVAGNDWVAWYYDDDFATVRRPAQCYRAKIPLDGKGIPDKLGLDIRMETDETPLVWFEKVHT